MRPLSRYIQRYYDRQPEKEWERLERHRTELAMTRRALAEHLPPPPARILDCGGGPGRYAIELAGQGYDVTLFDLSPANLRLAQEKAAAAGVVLAGYEQGTATDLARFGDESFDAVLLMGPLYHLLEEEERRQAIGEACRVLKVGGPLFAAFASRYAVLRYAATYEPLWIVEDADRLEAILASGTLAPQGDEDQGFVAHFVHPDEIIPLCRWAGLEVRALLGVEGLVSMIESEVTALSGPAWDAWVELNWRVAADPAIHGCVEHLLAVAVKPLWRAVLRQMALRLDEAGIRYTVVGGTSAALHGVPLAVKDIDLETDTAGAYRFADLFAGQALEPVSLRESDLYRSHLGRFDFKGVPVEVMGDLQRREGSKWVPTSSETTDTITLQGVPVHTSTLEEETLAYVRRKRLDRAALCLPYCDPEHLLALLRGQRSSGVL